MPTALAISPHLDDAVFSAGGTLARLAREGWRVVIATVFTASVPDPTGFALACQLDKGLGPDIDYMALRRAEDAAACAAIGARTRWLPFAEAPHRGYHSAADLFGGLHGNDDIIAAIKPALADLLRDLQPEAVYAPQAIGAHVDHVAVYLAVQACDRTLRLWADFPYVAKAAARPSPFAGELRHYPETDAELARDEVDVKAMASSLYTTQIGFQFGGAEATRQAIQELGRREAFRETR